MRGIFCCVGILLLCAAFWIGHMTPGLGPGLLFLIVCTALCALITMALRVDYVYHFSLPKHLVTLDMATLLSELGQFTTDKTTALYVEGKSAYHPIAGAFFARIGDKPAVVLHMRRPDA